MSHCAALEELHLKPIHIANCKNGEREYNETKKNIYLVDFDAVLFYALAIRYISLRPQRAHTRSRVYWFFF